MPLSHAERQKKFRKRHLEKLGEEVKEKESKRRKEKRFVNVEVEREKERENDDSESTILMSKDKEPTGASKNFEDEKLESLLNEALADISSALKMVNFLLGHNQASLTLRFFYMGQH